MKFIDITGQKFGKLTVVGIGFRKENPNGDVRIHWECLCECGKKTFALKSDLKMGKKTTCGCSILSRPKKHGLCYTGFYRVWSSMKDRCLRETNTHFHDYGGRGISVCKRWFEFINFRDDMYLLYLKHVEHFGRRNTTLDRIDNNKGYSLKNCRWTTTKVQQSNKRNSKNKC